MYSTKRNILVGLLVAAIFTAICTCEWWAGLVLAALM